MKVRTKLIVGFLTVVILMFVLLLYAISSLFLLNNKMNSIVNDQYVKMKYMTQIQNSISNIAKGTSSLILTDSTDQKQKIANELISEKENASAALTSLSRLSEPGEVQLILTKLARTGAAYLAYQDQVIALSIAGKKDQAIQLRTEQGAIKQKDLFDAIGAMTTLQNEALVQAGIESDHVYRGTLKLIIIFAVIGLIAIIGIMYWIMRNISTRLQTVLKYMEKITNGTVDHNSMKLIEGPEDEIGAVARAFNLMAVSLKEKERAETAYNKDIQEQSWLKDNVARISTTIQGISNRNRLAETFIAEITQLVGANCGVFYEVYFEGNQRYLKLLSSYAYGENPNAAQRIRFGEGLVGQCAINNKMTVLIDAPANYLRINSGLGGMDPVNILILPVSFEQQTIAVIELASLKVFSPIQLTKLQQLASHIGIILDSLDRQKRIEQLLEDSQALTEELQSQSEELIMQQEELARTNVELEEQTTFLQDSERLLQRQQEELKRVNEKLQLKADLLEQQNQLYLIKNHEVETTREELETRAHQLAISSKYKSEFLANMSHELRTPLNSMLILAKLLADNSNGNLTSKQIEFAKTIYSSGEALLLLINEILDLSKVESGRIDLHPQYILYQDIVEFINRNFLPLAQQKGLEFSVSTDLGLSERICTDLQRLEQILQNLLSNAFKFTSSGMVSVTISSVAKNVRVTDESLLSAERVIAFRVSDTGIGIPRDKHELIFEAFHQADGKTSRKYGGTGLGLSISRELAQLLGGIIRLESQEDQGSSFTLYLPDILISSDMASDIPIEQRMLIEQPILIAAPEYQLSLAHAETSAYQESPIELQGKAHLPFAYGGQLDGLKILLVDDDIRNVFALSSALENYHLDVIVAENGREGIQVLEETPDIKLILMDLMMPEMDGYEAIRIIRNDPAHLSLPVVALTAKAMKDDRDKCIEAGASDYITKPVNIDELLSLMKVWLCK